MYGNSSTLATFIVVTLQTLLLQLELDVPEGSMHDVSVQFLTPIDQPGVIEICSLAVVSVGANLPCMRKEPIDDTATMR